MTGLSAFKKLYLVFAKLPYMEQGWDTDVKRFFVKIISSFSYGIMWLAAAFTAGLYYRLGYRTDIPVAYIILFYLCLLGSLLLLLRYFYRVWRK